jgi:hypothetical protein
MAGHTFSIVGTDGELVAVIIIYADYAGTCTV